VPWVTLMQFDGPPEALLERCAEKIEREASHARERADLLAVSQVLMGAAVSQSRSVDLARR
jgi:hypothetical protein